MNQNPKTSHGQFPLRFVACIYLTMLFTLLLKVAFIFCIGEENIFNKHFPLNKYFTNYKVIVTSNLFFPDENEREGKVLKLSPTVQKFEISGALIPFLATTLSPDWSMVLRKGSHVNKYSQRIFLKKTQMRSPTF